VLFRFLTQECHRLGLSPGPPSLELRPRTRRHPHGLRAAGRRADPDPEEATALKTRIPSAGASPEFRITYDAVLVEESVLLAERRLSAAEAAAFRAERDRIYEVDEPDEREARFEELHGRFFLQLGLDRPLHEVLADRSELLLRSRGCRVLPASSRREEMADVRADVRRAIERDHPGWRPEQGRCARCAEVYEALQ
jgi:hypothetical protein